MLDAKSVSRSRTRVCRQARRRDARAGTRGPTIQEAFPAEGFDCTPPEELPTPTPEQLDKAFEQPAADSKELEIQCGPLNNASRTFREKYC